MTSLIGRIASRQIVPGSTGAQNPEHPVPHRTRVLPRPAAPIFPPPGTEQRFQKRPLGVGEVHASDLLCFPSLAIAQSLKCVYEITSSHSNQSNKWSIWKGGTQPQPGRFEV